MSETITISKGVLGFLIALLSVITPAAIVLLDYADGKSNVAQLDYRLTKAEEKVEANEKLLHVQESKIIRLDGVISNLKSELSFLRRASQGKRTDPANRP